MRTTDAELTPTEQARQWVLNLGAFTWFRGTDVPGPRQAVRTMLSRLLHAKQPPITRRGHGLYRREPPWEHRLYGWVAAEDTSSYRAFAPREGSGLAEGTALLTLGLSNQMPLRVQLATTHRNLKEPEEHHLKCWIKHRNNTRRNELTWHEVTLLEAARYGVLWTRKYPLERLLANVTSGFRQRMVGADPLIRRDKLLWAAEAERPSIRGWEPAMREKLALLADLLPPVLSDHNLLR